MALRRRKRKDMRLRLKLDGNSILMHSYKVTEKSRCLQEVRAEGDLVGEGAKDKRGGACGGRGELRVGSL